MTADEYLEVLIQQQHEKIAGLTGQLSELRDKELCVRAGLNEAQWDLKRFECHRETIKTENKIPTLDQWLTINKAGRRTPS